MCTGVATVAPARTSPEYARLGAPGSDRWWPRPFNAHVGPLIRAWAAPPTLSIAGFRAIERVSTRNSGLACDQHTTTDTVAPKTQTTSPLAARFQCFSPRWSAIWAPHHCKPRPRRRQSGGIARHGGPTRRRHGVRRLRVVQNPHRSLAWRLPRRLQDRRSTGWRDKTRPTPQPQNKERGTAWPRSP